MGYTSQQAGTIYMKYHCSPHQLLPVRGCPERRQQHPQAGQVSDIWRQKRAGEERRRTHFLSPWHADHCKRVGAHREKWHLRCQAQVWYHDSSSPSEEQKQVASCSGSKPLLAARSLLRHCSAEGFGRSCASLVALCSPELFKRVKNHIR